MLGTEEITYGELLSDWEKLDEAYMSSRGGAPPIGDEKELGKIAGGIASSLRELGWGISYESVSFETLPKSIGGRTRKGHIFMNQALKGDPYVYHSLVHEMMHASGVRGETLADFLAMEAGCELAIKGDKRFLESEYRMLRGWVRGSLELKARKEGVPDEYAEEVGKVRKGASGLSEEQLYSYQFTPYHTLKKAKEGGKKKVIIEGREISIDGLLEVWGGLD